MEPSAPTVAVAPGDILAGKYTVERILGRGGMGVVVAARHRDLDETFAIKLLLPQAASEPQAVDRFLREARAAVRLKGEHVAKVTDVGRLENGLPYIVMEHLSGVDLRQHLRASGPLPLGEAVTHILQACEAIAEAHANGIVHRDLKPANLFLTRRANGTSCIKVLDFGISKHTVPEAVDITRTGEILGTPLYMAPEQMARMKDADARCDIWSMGVVLYELLTGTTPFHGTMITEIIARVLQEEAAPPSRLRPDLPPAMDAILLHCLRKRPNERFQTIVELASALRAAGMAGVDTGPRQVSFPDLSISSRSTASVPALTGSPAETGTIHLSASSLPTQPLPSSASGAPGPGVNTASSWGATGPLRPAKSSGLVWLLGGLGATAVVVASLGIWVAIRGAAGDTSGTPTPGAAGALTAEATPPEATGGVTVAPAVTEPPAATAAATASTTVAVSGATAAPSGAQAAPPATVAGTPSSTTATPGAAARSAATSATAATKPTGKKPAAPDPSKFGGIR